MQKKNPNEYVVDNQEIYRYKGRICIPDQDNVKNQVLKEAHFSPFSMHPGSTKMYQDIKKLYWWNNMKREIAEYVAKCLTCQQVKADHQKNPGKLKSLEVPE